MAGSFRGLPSFLVSLAGAKDPPGHLELSASLLTRMTPAHLGQRNTHAENEHTSLE